MPRFDAAAAFAGAPTAVLTTVRPDGAPHVVPIVFAVLGDVVFTAVDAKRKSTQRLQRLANIADEPRVSLLVDHYQEDWSRLWWARADGTATVHDAGDAMAEGHALLRAKYRQYDRIALDGPVVTVDVARWTGWHA